MTSTQRALTQSHPAPPSYVADPWQDWKRHIARIRGRRMVTLWRGGRPVVLTMCGMLGQTGTDVRHAKDCAACHQVRTDEQSSAAKARDQKAAR